MPIMCCGQAMKRIEPGTTEASTEKHILIPGRGNKVMVTVGSCGPSDGAGTLYPVDFPADQERKPAQSLKPGR